MGNKKWTRVLALVLAVICTLTVVAAAGIDRNGDGKYTVYDLQLLFAAGEKENYAETLKQVMGGHGDELNPNENGEYEIYSEFGLRNMARVVKAHDKDGLDLTFKLMNDIDMKGANWATLPMFRGTFVGDGDGDGKPNAISNVKISDYAIRNKDESGNATGYHQGFFGKIGRNGVVQDLNLEYMILDATNIPGDANNYIGLLAGANIGTVTNCTTIGKVIDTRTELCKKDGTATTAYIGTIVGWIESASDTTGTVTVESERLLRAEDENLVKVLREESLQKRTAQFSYGSSAKTDASDLTAAKTTVRNAVGTKGQPVVSKMAIDYGTLTRGSRITKIIGRYPNQASSMSSYNWQDISGSIVWQDAVIAQRREDVVKVMYDMCTVQWKPSQTMTIYKYRGGTGNLNYGEETWEAGETWRGMPYNYGSGSLERFNSFLDTNGKTLTTLPTSAYYYMHTETLRAMTNGADSTYTYNGTTYKIGDGFKVSDQPLAQGVAVAAGDHAGFSRYIGNDCSSSIQWAWRKVVSSDVANGGTLIAGVTEMTPTTTNQSRYGVTPVNGLVPTSTDINAYYKELGENAQSVFVNAYTKASRGDALITNGHSRMIAYDPIVIMNADGTVDLDKSYFITHEQGRSSYQLNYDDHNNNHWRSNCTANCLYTFKQLTEYSGMTTGTWGIGSSGHYMPVSLPAFQTVEQNGEDVTAAKLWLEGTAIHSNFFILSTKLEDGDEVFTAVTQHQYDDATKKNLVGNGYRDGHIEVTMDELIAAHGEDVAGKTVTVKLSNGDVYSVDLAAGTCTKN